MFRRFSLIVALAVALPLAAANAAPLALQAVMQHSGHGGDLSTGLYVRSNVDLAVSGEVPIQFERVYRTNDTRSRALGVGTNDNYDMFLVGDATTFSFVDLVLPDGGRIHYVRLGPWTDIGHIVLEHSATPTAYLHSRLTWNGRGWDIRFRDGSLMQLSGCNSSSRPGQCGILAIKSATDTLLTMTRNAQGDLMSVASPDGHRIDFQYDTGHRICLAKASTGANVAYSYDPEGHLTDVRPSSGVASKYEYDSHSNLVSIVEPGWRIHNSYDDNGRIAHQTGNWPGAFAFEYVAGTQGSIRATQVTDPDGSLRRLAFNPDGYTVEDVHQIGDLWKSTLLLERAPGSNAVLSARVKCEPNGDEVVLTAADWAQADASGLRSPADVVCLVLLHDSQRRQRVEMAMNREEKLLN